MKILHTTSATGIQKKPIHWSRTLSDYLNLTKPRVIVLLLITTLVAMVVGEETIPSPTLLLWTLLGGYFAAGGAGAINCAIESDIDRVMQRTDQRPVAAGRILPQHAFRFGIILCIGSFVILFYAANLLAALLALLGIGYYVLLYTLLLKRRTWLNIVIGGGAGALPPLVGCAAVSGTLNPVALMMTAIIFLWSPPHFWTLALVKQKDYARAGIPMLPVVAGAEKTRWHILLYSVLTVVSSMLPIAIAHMGWVYLIIALVLNLFFLSYAWKTYRLGDMQITRAFFRYTIIYLSLLFVSMMIDKFIGQLIT